MAPPPFQLSIEGFPADLFRAHFFAGKEILSEAYAFDLMRYYHNRIRLDPGDTTSGGGRCPDGSGPPADLHARTIATEDDVKDLLSIAAVEIST